MCCSSGLVPCHLCPVSEGDAVSAMRDELAAAESRIKSLETVAESRLSQQDSAICT